MEVFSNIYNQDHNNVTASKDNTKILYINYNILKYVCREDYELTLMRLEIQLIMQKDQALRYIHRDMQKQIIDQVHFQNEKEQLVIMQDIKQTDKIIFVLKGRIILIAENKNKYPQAESGGTFADQTLNLMNR